MTVTQDDKRYDLMNEPQRKAWWDETRGSARSTLQMASGTRMFVTESFETLAFTGRELRFVEVHVVSTSTGSPYEIFRIIHEPGLRRLIPIDNIASIAPITDAETSVEAGR